MSVSEQFRYCKNYLLIEIISLWSIQYRRSDNHSNRYLFDMLYYVLDFSFFLNDKFFAVVSTAKNLSFQLSVIFYLMQIESYYFHHIFVNVNIKYLDNKILNIIFIKGRISGSWKSRDFYEFIVCINCFKTI